jgi:hypothetical protein
VLDRWDEISDERGYAVHATTAEAVTFREQLISTELGARSS